MRPASFVYACIERFASPVTIKLGEAMHRRLGLPNPSPAAHADLLM